MDDKKLLRYSMQLSMLKQLLSKKLINENEYQIILKRLMKDYCELPKKSPLNKF